MGLYQAMNALVRVTSLETRDAACTLLSRDQGVAVVSSLPSLHITSCDCSSKIEPPMKFKVTSLGPQEVSAPMRKFRSGIQVAPLITLPSEERCLRK